MLVTSLTAAFRQALLLALMSSTMGRALLKLLHIELGRDPGIALPQSGKRVVQSLDPGRIFGANRFVVGARPSSNQFLVPLLVRCQCRG